MEDSTENTEPTMSAKAENASISTSAPCISASLLEMRQRIKESASKCDEPGKHFLKAMLSDQSSDQSLAVNYNECSPVWSKIEEVQSKCAFPADWKAPDLFHLLGYFNTSHIDALMYVFQQLKDELNNKIQLLDELSLVIFLKETIGFLSFKELRTIPLTILRKMPRIPPIYLRLLVEKNMIHEFAWPIRRQAWENNNDLFIKSIEEVCANFIHNDSMRNESFNQLHEKIGPSEILFRSFASYCVSSYLKDRSNQWGRLLTNMVIHLNEAGLQIKSLTKLHELASMIDRCRRQGKIDYVALKSIRETIKGLILAQAAYEEKMHKNEMERHQTTNLKSKEGKALKAPDSNELACDNNNTFVERKSLLGAVKFLNEKDTWKIFAQPVTEQIAPRYFEFIRNPMDLSTMKKKIEKEKYNTWEDFHKDVELMFENCKTFNNRTSELGKYAEELHKIWKEKYSSLLREQSKRSNSSKRDIIVKSVDDLSSQEKRVSTNTFEKAQVDQVLPPLEAVPISKEDTYTSLLQEREYATKLKNVLQEGFDFLLHLDHSKIFVEKVTDRIAPDYSKHVKTPMYLNLIKSKLKLGGYQSLAAFNDDVRLMFSNCVAYNGEESYYGVYAKSLLNEWEKKYSTFLKQLPSSCSVLNADGKSDLIKQKAESSEGKQHSLISITVDSQDVQTVAHIIGPVLWEEWQFFAALDTLDVFANEVDLVGYRDLIKQPMDLGTMKQKLFGGLYLSIDTFHKDFALMLDNCVTFNGKEDPFGQYANLVRKYWLCGRDYFAKKSAYFQQDPGVIHRIGPNWDGKQIKSLKMWSGDERKSIETLVAMETPDAKRGANLAMLQTVLKIAIDFLLTIDMNQFFFQVPTDAVAPNYSKVIDQPTSISICQGKVAKNLYKSVDNLHQDVLMILKNCFTYNGCESEYSKAAMSLAAKWYLFYLILRAKFPYLFARREPFVIKESNQLVPNYEQDQADGVNSGQGMKRKFDDSNGTIGGSRTKKANMKESDLIPKLSSSAPASETPFATECREQVESFLLESKEGVYSAMILRATDGSDSQSEPIQISSILLYNDIHDIWHKQSLNLLQNLFTLLLRYISRLDESRLFSRPMQQQIQNSKVISNLMDLGTMKIKIDRNSYKAIESFHDDVILMIRNCFLQFLHEEKNPSKKYPNIVVDTKQAAKTAQKIHFAWNIAYQNLTAVLNNDPSKAIHAIHGIQIRTSTDATREALPPGENLKNCNEDLNEGLDEHQITAPGKVQTSESLRPVSSAMEIEDRGRQDLFDNFQENQKAIDINSILQKGKLSPKESQLLRSSLEARKQLQTFQHVGQVAGSEQASTTNLTELPSVLTTSAFTWTILMLIEPQLQHFFARFLAILMCKHLKDKIQSPLNTEMILGQEKLYRFLCQLCQLTMAKDLNLPAVEDILIRFYLPSLLVRCTVVPTSKNVPAEAEKQFIEELIGKYAVPLDSSLDHAAVRSFLEKFLHHLLVVRSKSTDTVASVNR